MKPPRRPGTKTVEQAAALFGVSPRTVYRWRREGLLEGVRIGNFIVFRDEEIERFNTEQFNGIPVEQAAAS